MSTHYLDDQSVYDQENGEGIILKDAESSLRKTETQKPEEDAESLSDPENISEKDIEKEEEVEEVETPIQEVRAGIRDERDVELGSAQLEKKQSTKSARDPNLVTWDSPDDSANPKNWSMKRKWAATLIVSCFTLVSPMASSMVAPALGTMSREFHITNSVESQLMLSIFILAYSVGPLFLGPLSEIYGRVLVLQLSNLFFLAWNIGCGFARSSGQMLAFRFLSGLGGSAPLAIGGGLLSDCFDAEQRGRAISIYSLAPLFGPAIGPIAGGFVTQNTTWRWTFHATSIFTAVVQCFGIFFLQETYAPKLLKRKADRLRKETGNNALHTEYETPDKTLFNILKTALTRPFRLLGTQPIIQVLAIYMAYLYGMMYLVLSTFPGLWNDRYHESIGIGGLNYISLALGFFLGTQICAPINDRIYRKLRKRNNNVGKPEFRAPLMIPGSILVPVGLFWYGWTAQAHTHWILPNIGAVMFSAGMIIEFQCIQTYIVDAYTRYAASAIGAATVLRSLAGFGFPLFAPAMYDKLDYGWGNSVLGFIGVALGIPAPFLLWKYGALLRAKSRFAAG
ncbi:MFS general substrate transporter [Cenococcum geophilum 1.58]|uniref:MFS general substrate transporter n=1 Tax=Cenococcum geophilum 1.58 TaxID=794803 RepID=UPI00358DE355|nr:MFS general substrate transporter [Cenococcum geophilum 1.58]